MRKIINTNIRLNLENDADRQAWEYLQSMDRKKYKSYSKAVVIALNDYFNRQKKIKKDYYLETREKEDAFLEKVLATIEQGLKSSSPNNALSNLLQLLNGAQMKTDLSDTASDNDEYADTALDFADSF